MSPNMSFIRVLSITSLVLLGCASTNVSHAETSSSLPSYVTEEFGHPPPSITGPLSPEIHAALDTAFIKSVTLPTWAENEEQALDQIVASKDLRLVWLISDLMRFAASQHLNESLTDAASKLMGKELSYQNSWGVVTDHLIAWDVPAPPDYLKYKRGIFTGIVPGWDNIFVEGDLDWRVVSWGGVLIDNRAYDTTDNGCNCIPAVDNPEVSSAEDATWLKDDDIVFGIEINGESRAYPRRIMEVREMVNDTLGGRDLGIPYCTLCGAAQAYFTDGLPAGVERPILRTSGLLSRSNKVMYDIQTYSVFDTFLGHAVTGPLAKKKLQLKQATVITSDWGTWKKEHPETTVMLERYALGSDPDFRNGRDANGPIFPIGDVDPRLSVHEDVIGVISESGKPIAFQRSTAIAALLRGDEITFENIRLELRAGGVAAVDVDGSELGSHQAFWFAWSQFHPKTELWAG
ncbi:DUF3179 domain-containing (seleno)protein [Sulfitobacter donghicola]|uniref:DUF3179 domain-containing (seleno)protein n=1 Tax=Sulfitobacter donghicola TaxID=421000 RepID=UPI001FDEBECF|nr:DUF3179 domain-containing (seleno)protein [Sulfitobacter donghicola]KIN67053.1 DUF3179 domain containing protein [Sulfitobacter donghicola DSW-25 = KCTC 12864 = JCM 14565]